MARCCSFSPQRVLSYPPARFCAHPTRQSLIPPSRPARDEPAPPAPPGLLKGHCAGGSSRGGRQQSVPPSEHTRSLGSCPFCWAASPSCAPPGPLTLCVCVVCLFLPWSSPLFPFQGVGALLPFQTRKGRLSSSVSPQTPIQRMGEKIKRERQRGSARC